MGEGTDSKKSALTLDVEKDTLLKTITALERENKTLQGQIESASPKVLEELKARNKDLKSTLLAVEKALALELLDRKTPIDAAGCTDKLQVFKAEVLTYCTDRKLDTLIWKKLESL